MYKKYTPYAFNKTTKMCMYCGEVFITKYIYDSSGKYFQISAMKQLEDHYINMHKKVQIK